MLGHAEVVRLLLAGGAQSDRRNGRGHTALEGAAERGHLAVVNLLPDRPPSSDTLLQRVPSRGGLRRHSQQGHGPEIVG